MKIGFVILSHSNPGQLRRLVSALLRVYDNPVIACHHDFSQCALDKSDFPNVQFVSPHVKTKWAQFSVVRAALGALALLYDHDAPDWFYVLSASDYPTAKRDQVIRDIESSNADAFLDFREATDPRTALQPPLAGNPALAHFCTSGNNLIAWQRYVGINLWWPVVKSGPRIGRKTIRFSAKSASSPFDSSFKCFFGDHWFSANGKAADILLNPTEQHRRLQRHLHMRSSPDECYYQTVLANATGLKIDTSTRRYSRWNGGGAHPQSLTANDLPEIVSTKSHFARKFIHNDPVLDKIDRTILEL